MIPYGEGELFAVPLRYRFARAAIVLCYSAIADAAASANGLPSESRHTAH